MVDDDDEVMFGYEVHQAECRERQRCGWIVMLCH